MAKKTVMIIEDDLLHMKLFHDILEAHGYEIIRCPESVNALEIAGNEHPDLVLLDICMPHVSGFDIVKDLKSNKDLKATPVIAVSGMASNYEEVDYLIEGFDAFIPKPITVPNFLATIAGFVSPVPFPAHKVA
ncbi:MAG: response regulator [Proteobacteria bacterium]|nr:response regulator [Pseudomonadota bacterium]MDA1022452.1 response regulator [Pseudomonadota bacterium]